MRTFIAILAIATSISLVMAKKCASTCRFCDYYIGDGKTKEHKRCWIGGCVGLGPDPGCICYPKKWNTDKTWPPKVDGGDSPCEGLCTNDNDVACSSID